MCGQQKPKQSNTRRHSQVHQLSSSGVTPWLAGMQTSWQTEETCAPGDPVPVPASSFLEEIPQCMEREVGLCHKSLHNQAHVYV